MADITEREKPAVVSTVHPESRKRMHWIDLAKGMAIILVVYRHSIVGLNRAGLTVPDLVFDIQEFVFNFRMPVFFLLSGIFLARTISRLSRKELVQKKATTLLYPYLLWTVIFISIQIIFSEYTNSQRTTYDYLYIITQPRELDHMWYLLALFTTSVLLILIPSWLYRKPALHLLFAVGLHLFSYVIADYSLFSDLCYHYFFLAAGAIISPHLFNSPGIRVGRTVLITLAILPIFIAGQLYWLRERETDIIGMHALFLVITSLACVFFYLCCRLMYAARVFSFLNPIGKNSLYIYILHLFVIAIVRIVATRVFGIENIYLIISLSIVLGITIPMIIYEAGKKWGIRYLFSLDQPRLKTHG